MATKGSSIPERIARWKVIAAGLKTLLPEMPHLTQMHGELERIIRRYLVIEDEDAIRVELGSKSGPGMLEEEELLDSGARLRDIVGRTVARVEARAIDSALQRTRWNKKRAAAELGISYKSLLNKIHLYRLES